MNMIPGTAEAWRLHVAISHASSDSREAPWYGAWNLVLQDIIFRSFCQSPYLTITYPQYPVSKDIDTDDADDDNDEDEDEDKTGNDDGGKNKYNISSGDVRMSRPIDRATAPSPEHMRSPQKEHLPSTPPPPSAPGPKIRTTCIPDILQMLFQLRLQKGSNIPYFPSQCHNRTILIVEIKKATKNPGLEKFGEIFPQTDRQARHVFHVSPKTTTLGVIIAIGPYWTYGEYFRSDLRPSPSFSERGDPTYRDPAPLPETFRIRYYPPFVTLAAQSVLLLQTQASDNGLQIVRKRLQQINL